MTEEEFESILDDESIPVKWEGDNAFQGLVILSKYTQNLISTAEHDIIFSEDVETLVKAGITKEDVISLRKLNWMIRDGSLVCFV